jgi:hypothetical protein
MATANTILGTLSWAAASILNRPTQNVAGSYQEPALTNANWIMSTILGPPFAWQWNRGTASFTTNAGQSDYVVNIPTFGWLEKATYSNVNSNPPIVELEISPLLAASGKNNPPFKICVVFDNNAGQITFRLMSIPDNTYTISLTYQNAPIFATSLYSGIPMAITSVIASPTVSTDYLGTFPSGGSNALVGQYFQIVGFTGANTPNNGLYLCTSSSTTVLQLQNPNTVAVTANALAYSTVTWAPIPDKYNFLYETGMLSRLYTIYDRAAYLTEIQLFYRSLVGVSEGLSDIAKAIFLEDKLQQIRTEQAAQMASSGSPKRGQ